MKNGGSGHYVKWNLLVKKIWSLTVPPPPYVDPDGKTMNKKSGYLTMNSDGPFIAFALPRGTIRGR